MEKWIERLAWGGAALLALAGLLGLLDPVKALLVAVLLGGVAELME